MGVAYARCILGVRRADFVDTETKEFAGIIQKKRLQMDAQSFFGCGAAWRMRSIVVATLCRISELSGRL